ncbi:MAG: hypothetical protein JNL42_15205 [Anaerolineae bacterium]|nr:hypothetical protein [Anaerolineae bacterium]
MKSGRYGFAIYVCALFALLIALPARAQEMPSPWAVMPQTFAFDFTGRLSVQDLDSFTLDLRLDGNGAVDVPARSFRLDLTGMLVLGSDPPLDITTQARWIDNNLYLNFGDGWQKMEDAGAFATRVLAMFGLMGMDGALAEWDLSRMGGVSGVLEALAAADPAEFAEVEALPDEIADGVTARHLRFTADIHALMQVGAFFGAVLALAQAQGTDIVLYDYDELVRVVGDNSRLFEGSRLMVDEVIGAEDGLLRRFVVALNLFMQPGVLGYSEPPFSVSAALDVAIREGDQPQTIAPPPDAATVAAFAPPARTVAPPSDQGRTEYVFFETLDGDMIYRLPLPLMAQDRLTVLVRGVGLVFDSYVQVIAPDGEVFADNDDAETILFGMGGLDSVIPPSLITADGTYTVEVGEYSGDSGVFVLTVVVER